MAFLARSTGDLVFMDRDYPQLEYAGQSIIGISTNTYPVLEFEGRNNSGMSTVAEYIEAEMKARGLKPRTLAMAAGMNYSTLHRILHAQGEPRRTTLEPLAKYFKVSIDQMFSGEKPKPTTPKKRAESIYRELMTLPPDERAAVLARVAGSLSK